MEQWIPKQNNAYIHNLGENAERKQRTLVVYFLETEKHKSLFNRGNKFLESNIRVQYQNQFI